MSTTTATTTPITTRYAYYPGCSLHTSAKEFDISTRVVLKELGVELQELQDWSCCGGSVAAGVSHQAGMAMAARNVALAQKQNLDLLASCSGCYNKSARALKALQEDKEEFERISAILSEMGLDVSAYNIRVRNVVDVLANDLWDTLTSRIRKPLKGVKVACYYGCLLTRPADITGWDSPVFPISMDNLCRLCGAEVVDFRGKTKCCGGPILISQEEIALQLTKQILDEAKEKGADCIVLACPLCDTNLELRQADIEKKYNTNYNLPIVYITEIVGLALGLSPRKLGMDKHIVSTKPLLAKIR